MASLPGHRAAIAPVNDLIAAGARAVELMVAPALIVAATTSAARPQSWRELDPASAALLVEFGGADDAELDAAEARAAEVLAGHELIRAPDFHRDHETVEIYWTVREGLHGLVGKMRPPGTALIVEDVCVPPARIAEWRPRPAGAARRARLPHRRRRPRLGRQPALHAHPGLRQARGPRALRRLHGEADRADRRPVRRLAEGRARHRASTWRRSSSASGATKATELMRRVKRLADPDGVLGARRRAQRRPRRPPAQPEDDAADRGRGDDLRRVRLLRAGLPEPRPDDDAAPADRPAPRDGAPGARLAGARGAAGGVRVRRARDLRRRRHLRARLPAGDRHRQAGQGAARASSAARAPSKVALRLAERWESVERAARAGLAAGDARTARVAERCAAPAARARRAISSELVPAVAREHAAARRPRSCRRRHARAPPPSTCRPASTGSSAARATAATGPSLPEALVAVSARAGLPLWIPDDVAGHCCATPWTSKGYAAGARRMANHTVGALWRWSDGGRAAGRLRRELVHARACRGGGRRCSARSTPSATASSRSSTRSPGRASAAAATELKRKLASVAVHPPCASRHLEPTPTWPRSPATLADEVDVPVAATCCGFAGDRGLLHPELPLAATAEQAAELAGRHFDAAPVLEPHLRDRAPAGDRPHLRVVRLRARGADAVAKDDADGERLRS